MAGNFGSIKGHLRAAHKKSIRHRADIEKSERCGCFFCEQIFSPSLIQDWVDEDDIAICPLCGIDRVIGDASGIEITEAFLHEMRVAWFW